MLILVCLRVEVASFAASKNCLIQEDTLKHSESEYQYGEHVNVSKHPESLPLLRYCEHGLGSA